MSVAEGQLDRPARGGPSSKVGVAWQSPDGTKRASAPPGTPIQFCLPELSPPSLGFAGLCLVAPGFARLGSSTRARPHVHARTLVLPLGALASSLKCPTHEYHQWDRRAAIHNRLDDMQHHNAESGHSDH